MGNSVMLNGVEYAGEQIAYKDSTYELVSKVAYLIGVPLRIFQNEHEPPKIEIYNRLEQDKNARITLTWRLFLFCSLPRHRLLYPPGRAGGSLWCPIVAKAPGANPGPFPYYFFPCTMNPLNPAFFRRFSIFSALARTAKAPTWTRYRVSL